RLSGRSFDTHRYALHFRKVCVLDSEIVALAPDGRSEILRLDVPARVLPLIERKRRLRAFMPRPEVNARLLFHDQIDGPVVARFDAVRGKDLEASSQSGSTGATTRTGRRPRSSRFGTSSTRQPQHAWFVPQANLNLVNRAERTVPANGSVS